jgi:putative lipoic acid-binding regulatory protein
MNQPPSDPAPAQAPCLEYPLAYGFTIIGLAADDFPEHARRLVARHVAEVPVESVVVRASAGGKYHSVSVSVRLESDEQRRAVYRSLHEDARVVFVL